MTSRFIVYGYLLLKAFGAFADGRVEIREDQGQADLILDDSVVATFMHSRDRSSKERDHATYKPFLHVVDPETGHFVTKGPGGQFTHHRGIFIGWNRLAFDGRQFDFWHMKGVDQVHQAFSKRVQTRDTAGVTAMIHWNDQEREAILVESRTMTAAKLEGGGGQIDFISRLKSVRGDVHLKGDPEHAGVQFRPGNEVVRKQTRYLFHREGIDPKKDLDLPWVCESFELPFGKFAVVHLNHPKNPKGTRYSAYRDYGRFGAFSTSGIKQGETLSLRYRFLVFKEESPTREQIQAAYQRFANRD